MGRCGLLLLLTCHLLSEVRGQEPGLTVPKVPEVPKVPKVPKVPEVLEVLPNNCFSFANKSRWPQVLSLNTSAASLTVKVAEAGSPVLTCLRRQVSAVYQVAVVGDLSSARYLSPSDHQWQGRASVLLQAPPSFLYLIYPGRYRLRLTYCGAHTCEDTSMHETVFSDFINITSSLLPGCDIEIQEELQQQNNNNNSMLLPQPPEVSDMKVVFSFTFAPCSLHHYDTANLSLYSSSSRAECGQHLIYRETLPVLRAPEGGGGRRAVIQYHSPRLRGDRYYCVSVSLSHVSCRLAALRKDDLCQLQVSQAVWVPSLPLIASLIPFCTSHFACAWLYVAVAGATLLAFSLLLSLLLVRCCRRGEPALKPGDEVDFGGGELEEVHQQRLSWGSLHKEWESGEDRDRGKILLLYSPDTKLFKELQEALKSFLEVACHCDIYDLFDDALFDTIALDPSEWLQEFINDKEVKIIVISSIGAYHRQLALQGSTPLNLPDGLSDNILDGLFTSGLRFVSSHPGLMSSGRVATARYEMLHLTEETFRLAPPLGRCGVREFLVPTQLHELFCWVHHLKPLDIMGKPWANYHLEMQLLQDALKLARRDRGVMSSYTTIGNGGTML